MKQEYRKPQTRTMMSITARLLSGSGGIPEAPNTPKPNTPGSTTSNTTPTIGDMTEQNGVELNSRIRFHF